MSLGPANGFGAPLWWMDPPGEIVAEIIRDAHDEVPGNRMDHTHPDKTLCLQAHMRKGAAKSSERLRDAHIYVEGAGW